MTDSSDLETRLLLEALFERFGYDFRNYSGASLRRRLEAVMERTGDDSLSLLQHRVLHQPGFFSEMLQSLTVTTSEMFRDPIFFSKLRSQVFPLLRTYPTLNIWHAGCSSGEEVYSMAILLHEEGLLERSTLYATDINRGALAKAREGIYPTEDVRKSTASYQRAGGTRSFADYYTAAYDAVQFKSHLRKNIVFSEHNLVTDGVFCETHLILCRNVLIYFQRELQDRVLGLFRESLRRGGFLCLGSKEALEFSKHADSFTCLDRDDRIYARRAR